MSEPANPVVLPPISVSPLLDAYGMAFMEMGLRPNGSRQFGVHAGGRYPWHDRTPGAATLTSISGGKP